MLESLTMLNECIPNGHKNKTGLFFLQIISVIFLTVGAGLAPAHSTHGVEIGDIRADGLV